MKIFRVAMWSGPRSLSTAMMRSFGARGDCAVWDEPFYSAYLAETGIVHPMRDEIIAAGDTDPASVAARCAGAVPRKAPVFFQKHMAQHMIEGFPRGWMDDVCNVFLIRDPALVVASYSAKWPRPGLLDIGFVQQAELFDRIAERRNNPPLVVDATDIIADPRRTLSALCTRIGLKFTEAMLGWPRGPHQDDGVWGSHWYASVRASTGFAAPSSGCKPQVPASGQALVDAARPFYDRLAAHRIVAP